MKIRISSFILLTHVAAARARVGGGKKMNEQLPNEHSVMPGKLLLLYLDGLNETLNTYKVFRVPYFMGIIFL